ncbi:MAG: peptidoglycan DD-metalloendopeptidase family protein [Desulfuromonadales bacterium]
MSAKKFTILVIPEGSHRVRRFNVKRGAIGACLGLCLTVALAISWMTFDYFQNGLDRDELHRLKAQNRQQEKELQRLTASIGDLRQEMVVLAQNDAKVRVLSQLSKPRPETLVGMGGPPESDSDDLSTLQRQIDELRTAIDLRRESQEEIQGFLNDQRSLLAAKPKGWPVKGWLTSTFGMRKSPFTGRLKMHEGYDIAARTGTAVTATADGIVSRAETAPGYGKLVVIDHGYGYKTYYGHNSQLHVKVGQRVVRGDKIAAVGNTGSSTGPHLHYEVRLNGVPLSPKKFL